MNTKTITLPLPSRNLSPNARVHHFVLARHKKAYRRLVALECFQQVGILKIKSFELVYYHKTKRNRDDDNHISMFKSGRDGIADCFNQDDSEFICSGVRFEIDKDNPRLEIVFTEL